MTPQMPPTHEQNPEDEFEVVQLEQDGETYEAKIIPVLDSNEVPSRYTLADGTRVQLRTHILSVARVDDLREPDGSPVYFVNARSVVDSQTPARLKKPKD